MILHILARLLSLSKIKPYTEESLFAKSDHWRCNVNKSQELKQVSGWVQHAIDQPTFRWNSRLVAVLRGGALFESGTVKRVATRRWSTYTQAFVTLERSCRRDRHSKQGDDRKRSHRQPFDYIGQIQNQLSLDELGCWHTFERLFHATYSEKHFENSLGYPCLFTK